MVSYHITADRVQSSFGIGPCLAPVRHIKINIIAKYNQVTCPFYKHVKHRLFVKHMRPTPHEMLGVLYPSLCGSHKKLDLGKIIMEIFNMWVN